MLTRNQNGEHNNIHRPKSSFSYLLPSFLSVLTQVLFWFVLDLHYFHYSKLLFETSGKVPFNNLFKNQPDQENNNKKNAKEETLETGDKRKYR